MKKLSLKIKLLTLFLGIGILPALIISIISFVSSRNSLEEQIFHQFQSINHNKYNALHNYAERLKQDVKVFAQSEDVQESFRMLKEYHDEIKAEPTKGIDVKTEEYQALWKRVNNHLGKYQTIYGYYDAFIICAAHGHVLFSTAKESDLGQNVGLSGGPLTKSGLGVVWKNAKEEIAFADFAPYAPSNGKPAAFGAHPVKNFEGKTIAIAVLQMPLNSINQIMGERKGMGETGESYLVGPDLKMRSNSFLDPDNYSVDNSFLKNKIVNTDATKNALEGKDGAAIITNYKGEPVLSVYDTIEVFDGIKWAIISEIDKLEAFQKISDLRNIMIILSLISMGLISFLGFYFGNSVANPLMNFANQLKEVANQVGQASNELSNASQGLSSASNEQASSIEETSSSLEEITGMVENNVSNANNAFEVSNKVGEITKDTDEKMNKLKKSMDQILESNNKIERLVKVISNIGEKTEVMDEIVFQTKLLSFNASVEAERAGEYGRGFAVVAQEVGNLAQMSGKAAQEIATIVKDSIKEAETITKENKSRVEEGNNYLAETAEGLKEILKSAEEVSRGAKNVLNASQDQAKGLQQINKAIAQVDKATQENAATAEESASSSEELNSQVETMKEVIIGLFKLVEGQNDHSDDGQVEYQKKNHHLQSKEHKVLKFDKKVPPKFGHHHQEQNLDARPKMASNDDWEKL